jgi:hypothetical protein
MSASGGDGYGRALELLVAGALDINGQAAGNVTGLLLTVLTTKFGP